MGIKIKSVSFLLAVIFIRPNMDVLNELKAMDESLGYKGDKLSDFIRDQQAEQREERAAIRQKEKEETECKLKLETARLEKEKAEALLEVEKQRAEREIKIKKEQVENELKMKQVEHAHEMELLELKAKSGESIQEPDTIKAKGQNYPHLKKEKMKWTAVYTDLKGMPDLKTGNRNYGPHI